MGIPPTWFSQTNNYHRHNFNRYVFSNVAVKSSKPLLLIPNVIKPPKPPIPGGGWHVRQYPDKTVSLLDDSFTIEFFAVNHLKHSSIATTDWSLSQYRNVTNQWKPPSHFSNVTTPTFPRHFYCPPVLKHIIMLRCGIKSELFYKS